MSVALLSAALHDFCTDAKNVWKDNHWSFLKIKYQVMFSIQKSSDCMVVGVVGIQKTLHLISRFFIAYHINDKQQSTTVHCRSCTGNISSRCSVSVLFYIANMQNNQNSMLVGVASKGGKHWWHCPQMQYLGCWPKTNKKACRVQHCRLASQKIKTTTINSGLWLLVVVLSNGIH